MQFAQIAVMILMFLIAVFLILLVLVQRGRGGGLAGALGGAGGQSAFGTKAGDVFTRITIGTAFIWILMCALSVKVFNASTVDFNDPSLGAAKQTSSAGTDTGGITTDNNESPATGAPAGAGTAASVPGGSATVEQPLDGAVPTDGADTTK